MRNIVLGVSARKLASDIGDTLQHFLGLYSTIYFQSTYKIGVLGVIEAQHLHPWRA